MPISLSRQQLIIVGSAGFIVLFFLLVFVGVIPGLRPSIGPKSELIFWGIDNERAWESPISLWRQSHPNVAIKYRSFSEEIYEKELIDALAAGQGPDIFMFHNTWALKHGNKIVPANPEQINLNTFRNIFPDVAESDFVVNSQIYGLPISIDTLAILYNKEIFNNSRIAVAPSTWDDLKSDILKIREFKSGRVSRSAIALGGTSKSIDNATDILNLLMLQFKTPMTDKNSGRALFNNQNGLAALNFYTQFVSPQSSYYTWDDSFQKSLDSFATGKTAMVFAYAAQIPKIKSKNPFLNFAISPAPQFVKKEAINYPSYWGLTVSAKGKFQKEAWDFVVFVSTSEAAANAYLNATTKPPALRVLINMNLNNPNLGVFAAQVLTAKSWREIDNVAVSQIFDKVIESVIKGSRRPEQALQSAQSEYNDLLR